MARPLKPLVRGGGFYPSNKWTPLVYQGGKTTKQTEDSNSVAKVGTAKVGTATVG